MRECCAPEKYTDFIIVMGAQYEINLSIFRVIFDVGIFYLKDFLILFCINDYH